MLLKEKTSKSHKNIIIVGVGNRLLGDESIGPHIIDKLLQMHIPSNVEVIDCGCDLLSLILHLNKPQKIIIIDAIRAGGNPGEIYRLNYCELGAGGVEMQSSHQVGAINALGLLKQIYPVLVDCEVVIIGIEPKAIELTTCFSKEVKENIADILRLIFGEIYCSIPVSNRLERSLNYGHGEFRQINGKISTNARAKILP